MKLKIIYLSGFLLHLLSNLPAQNYLDYHHEINRAEALIVSEKFEAAEEIYLQTFLDYPVKFAKDLVIAAQVCTLNKHYYSAISLLKEAVEMGVKLECLKEIAALQVLFSTIRWKEVESNYADLRKRYLSKIDVDLAGTVSKMYQREQESKRTETYRSVVISNFEYLKRLMKERDVFPGEGLVGLDDDQLAAKLDNCSFGNSKVMATLLHYVNAFSELEEELVRAVQVGALHPREFAVIYTYEKERISILYQDTQKEKNPNLPNYDFDILLHRSGKNNDRINKDRRQFGIADIEVDAGKPTIEQKYGLRLKFGYK